MGEMAEGMLDGTFCSSCGEWLESDDPNGFPTLCGACERDQLRAQGKRPKDARPKCRHCGRRFAEPRDRDQHEQMKHTLQSQQMTGRGIA